MLEEQKGPTVVAHRTGREISKSQLEFSTTRPPTKKERVVAGLLTGRSWNRWEAVRELRDWCLHSTIAEIDGDGVRITRKHETVPGAFGKAHCVRYWLDAADTQNVARARALLASLRAKRGAS